MANRLTVAKINAIRTLHKSGHSNRKIAELLRVHRETVGKGPPPPRSRSIRRSRPAS